MAADPAGPAAPPHVEDAARGRAAKDTEAARAGAARWRALPVVASVAYLAAASLAAEGGRGVRPWAASTLALALAFRAPRAPGPRARVSAWAVSATIATLGASSGSPGLDLAGAAIATAASVVAAQSASALAAPPGLLAVGARRAWIATALVAVVWAPLLVASGLRLAGRATSTGPWIPLVTPLATLGIIGIALQATARRRALELGVLTRAQVGLTAAAGASLGVLVIVSLDLGAPHRAARLALVLAAHAVVLASLHGDAAALAARARRSAVLAIPAGALGVALAMAAPRGAAEIVLLTAASVAGVAALAARLEAPLRPEEGAWIDAFDAARRIAARLDPDDAIREALVALRAPAGDLAAAPALHLFDPPRAIAVDAAGYGREREVSLPDGLVALVAGEPDATLRREVLEALVVRRPDLRPFARWMEAEGALAVTLVARGGEPEGLLVVPHGRRTSPLALEEVLALKELADTLAGPLEARARLARSMQREQQARVRQVAAEDAAATLRHAHELEVGRHLHLAARLARPAESALYSPAARLALEAIARRVASGAPLGLVVPPGVDPVPFVARAHREGPRAGGPLVVVDCAQTTEHDLARWEDRRASPVALADRGLLVLCDGAALPAPVQRLVARALAEKRAPGERAEPLDVTLAFSAARPPAALVADGRLDPALADRLAEARDAPIVLPRLRERPEDLRALLGDRLAREGLRVRGAPMGIDPAALALLLEHPFPGETAELDALVVRMVASCEGDVVRARDVLAAGVAAPAPSG